MKKRARLNICGPLTPARTSWSSAATDIRCALRRFHAQIELFKRAAVSYEILIEAREPIDGWSVCTVCLSVERTTKVFSGRWRCGDCGVDTSNNSQRTLKEYLAENPSETLEKNLRAWGAVKGVRPAYKMLRSARYKCLMVLGRRTRGEPEPSSTAATP
jgi:hypothetical protein